VLLAGIGSVAAGTVFAPSPAGAVDGAVATPERPPGVAPGDGSASQAAGLDDPPEPVAARSEPTDAPTEGGASLEARTEAAARPVPVFELTDYQWPLPHGRITLPFGPSAWGSRLVEGEAFHDGLDLATFCGDRIVAAHTGVVVAAGRHYDTEMGWLGDLGPYLDRLEAKSLWTTLPIVIVIDDGNGYRSLYAHLSKVVVGKGDTVAAGDLIGYEGRTGRASGCHLHYGLFSPQETARFGIDPGVVERMLLPPWEIARVDPLLVLPHRPGLGPAARPGEASPAVGAKPPIE
jgi:murein DD-endopeptidase MepM/ murein hydrolase activator NlpD